MDVPLKTVIMAEHLQIGTFPDAGTGIVRHDGSPGEMAKRGGYTCPREDQSFSRITQSEDEGTRRQQEIEEKMALFPISLVEHGESDLHQSAKAEGEIPPPAFAFVLPC